MVEDHVLDQPPWNERRDVFFETWPQYVLDVGSHVDFCTRFDETHGGLLTAADTRYKHHALRVRFLQTLSLTFFRPFAVEYVTNLPDSVLISQINPGPIDGQDISPLGAVDYRRNRGPRCNCWRTWVTDRA